MSFNFNRLFKQYNDGLRTIYLWRSSLFWLDSRSVEKLHGYGQFE